MKSFRLIALYTGNFDGHLRNQMLNFCADCHVKVEEDTKERLCIKVERHQILPDDFFTLDTDRKDGCVKSVSAIIGKNGSGKTTIARLLCNLQNQKDWNGVLLYEHNGRLNGYMKQYTYNRLKITIVENNVTAEHKLDNQKTTIPFFSVFYFSPYFTTEQFIPYAKGCEYSEQIEENGKFFTDISTTGLICSQKLLEHFEVLLHRDLTKLYNIEEKIRLFEFLSVYHDKYQVTQKNEMNAVAMPNFEVPYPQYISIGVNDDGVNLDSRECQHIGFHGLVFKAYVARYDKDSGNVEDNEPTDSMEEDEDFDEESEHGQKNRDKTTFARTLHEFAEQFDFTSISVDEIIKFFEQNSPDWPQKESGQQTDLAELFKIIKKIVSISEGKNSQVSKAEVTYKDSRLNCRFGGNVIEDVCKLVSLHDLTQQVSPYLVFDVVPHMSSGEMSFLSLFARLYKFVKEKPKNENVVVFLDEAETTLHPEWQRRLISYSIRFCEDFLPYYNYQLIFASHSPMLLADLPRGNVVLLKTDDDGVKAKSDTVQGIVTQENNGDGVSHSDKESTDVSVGSLSRSYVDEDAKKQTFAAHIFDLYKDSFFLDQGTMGEFAASKVDALLKKINPPRPDTSKMKNEQMMKAAEEYQRKLREITINPDDLKVARLIGDPFLSRYVWRRLEELNKDYDTPEDEQGGEGDGDRS